MTGATEKGVDQLAGEATSFFESWVHLLLLPLECIGGLAGAPDTRYRSAPFSVPAAPVRRVLIPGLLLIGLARAGTRPESIPDAALSTEPSALGAGETTFHIVVDAHALGGTPGGTYWGGVTACVDPLRPQSGDDVVPVWMVIP